MFHDFRNWMLARQLLGVREVDFSITRKTKKFGLGRVLDEKRILDLAPAQATLLAKPQLEVNQRAGGRNAASS